MLSALDGKDYLASETNEKLPAEQPPAAEVDSHNELKNLIETTTRQLRWAVESYKVALKVEAMPPEVQDEVRENLGGCEETLNALFGEYIPEDRRKIAASVKFLTTKELAVQIAEEQTDTEKAGDLAQINLIASVMGTAGLRTPDGRGVIIHSTNVMSDTPVPIDKGMAFFVGRHEQVHGKCEPKFTILPDGNIERRTGCKVVVTDKKGNVVSAKHGELYEGQTDTLAIISSYGGELKRFDEVFSRYLREKTTESDRYPRQVLVVTRLMDFAFPGKMDEGVQFLGKCYYTCDSDGFFQGIREKIIAKNLPELTALYDEFVSVSADSGSTTEMVMAVRAIIEYKN